MNEDDKLSILAIVGYVCIWFLLKNIPEWGWLSGLGIAIVLVYLLVRWVRWINALINEYFW